MKNQTTTDTTISIKKQGLTSAIRSRSTRGVPLDKNGAILKSFIGDTTHLNHLKTELVG
jgi:hypothetical protein